MLKRPQVMRTKMKGKTITKTPANKYNKYHETMQYVISNAARRPLTTRLRVKNGPEVRSSAAFVVQMVLAQASSWPSGLVPAQAGKLTCAEPCHPGITCQRLGKSYRAVCERGP